MCILGKGLQVFPEESLPVFKACLALHRRYRPRGNRDILAIQSSISNALVSLDRDEEAIVLRRAIYSEWVATLGVSHEETVTIGLNLTSSLASLGLWDECRTLIRNQLLPAAQRLLGSNDDITLALNQTLAKALASTTDRTRDDLRLNNTRRRHESILINAGDSMLEAETMVQDVVQRRRRVFGPSHPSTENAEDAMSYLRKQLALA